MLGVLTFRRCYFRVTSKRFFPRNRNSLEPLRL